MLVHTRTIAAMRVDAVAIIPKVRARISPVFRDIVARIGDGLGSGVVESSEDQITRPEPWVEVDEVKTASDGKHSRRGSFRLFTEDIE
jgi:hypothetical protein